MANGIKECYWLCIIGPADGTKLPDGADMPMRTAVQSRFAALTGEFPKLCSSGWGLRPERMEVIRTINVLDESDSDYLAISKI